MNMCLFGAKTVMDQCSDYFSSRSGPLLLVGWKESYFVPSFEAFLSHAWPCFIGCFDSFMNIHPHEWVLRSGFYRSRALYITIILKVGHQTSLEPPFQLFKHLHLEPSALATREPPGAPGWATRGSGEHALGS